MTPAVEQDQTASAVMDHEHAIQTGLVEALCTAVEKGDEPARVDEILTQLVAYSSAHFMSEELLMRLVSYDDYDDHVADHIHMMDELDQMLALHQARQPVLVLDKARSALAFLARHIDTRDQRFAHWTPPELS
ncbi:MAG: hemerythrin family protein [Hydrogenophilaceae bacterium]